jgi:glycerophosphoryl diester phosphodiesterase
LFIGNSSNALAVWAHRGASVTERENTVPAFLAAARQGAAGVELDVRRAKDDSLVVHHEATLPDGRAILDLTRAELPDHVPLLEAALDACRDLLVNIEIKNVEADSDYDPEEQLAAAVTALVQRRDARDKVIVSSFSLATIDRVRELDPTVPTGYLTSPRWDQMTSLQRAADHGHVALHPHHTTVGKDLVDHAHERGLAVNTWTVDDPDRIRWLASLRVDAVITNVPDVAISALRGSAPPA